MADPASTAGTVVSGLVKVLLGKLSDIVDEELSLICGAKSHFLKLQNTLIAIDAVLEDAEQQKYRNNSITDWLRNLKYAAYDIEDVLDLISTERKQVSGKKPYRRLTGLYSRYGFAKQVKLISLQLDDIDQNKNRFLFQVQDPGKHREISIDRKHKSETSSYIEESGVFGRNQDKEWIVNRLMSSDSERFLVIPITGMGGIGKTTLAQLVYNHPRVTECFDLKLWVYVSENFVLQTVIGGIIQSAIPENCLNWTLQALQNRLHQISSCVG